MLMLVDTHGGADRSGWHDIGTAMVEGVSTEIVVVEGRRVSTSLWLLLTLLLLTLALMVRTALQLSTLLLVLECGAGG